VTNRSGIADASASLLRVERARRRPGSEIAPSSPIEDWRLDPVAHLVASPAAFTLVVLLALLLARLALFFTAESAPVPAGFWRESTCSIPGCVVTPDSKRYASNVIFMANDPDLFNPLGIVPLLQRASANEESFLNPSKKNGLSYSLVAAWIARATGLDPASAAAVVSLICALALALVMRRLFITRELPLLPLALFTLSPLVLLYSNAVMKETFDGLLLTGLLLLGPKVNWRHPYHLIASVLVVGMLYYDREYFLYIAFGLLAIRVAYSKPNRAAAVIGLGAGIAAYELATNSTLLSSLALIRQVNENAYGIQSLGLGALATRQLFGPISRQMSSADALYSLFSLSTFLGYGLYLWTLMGAKRFARGDLVRWLRSRFNPYMVVFLLAMIAFAVVYGGEPRGRDGVLFLFSVGLATAIQGRGDATSMPWRPARSSIIVQRGSALLAGGLITVAALAVILTLYMSR